MSGLVMSGLVMSGFVMSGLVISGLVMSGLTAVVLCRVIGPHGCRGGAPQPIELICAMVTLTLGYFRIELTNKERDTVLRGKAITSTKLTQLNPAGGMV